MDNQRRRPAEWAGRQCVLGQGQRRSRRINSVRALNAFFMRPSAIEPSCGMSPSWTGVLHLVEGDERSVYAAVADDEVVDALQIDRLARRRDPEQRAVVGAGQALMNQDVVALFGERHDAQMEVRNAGEGLVEVGGNLVDITAGPGGEAVDGRVVPHLKAESRRSNLALDVDRVSNLSPW